MRHFLCTDPAVSATLPARVRRLVAAVAVAAALAPCALIAPRTAHAAGQIPAGVWGNDISYPQCNKPYPNGAGFGVIGLLRWYHYRPAPYSNPSIAAAAEQHAIAANFPATEAFADSYARRLIDAWHPKLPVLPTT